MVGFLFFPGQLQQVIGRFLIDHIDPIGVKQVSIAAPLEAGLLTAVIVGIVKFRLLRVKALVFVIYGRMAGLGNEVAVIKAAQERMEVCRKSIGIDAVELFGEHDLWYIVVIV